MSREDVCKLRSRTRVFVAKQKNNNKKIYIYILFFSNHLFSFPFASIEHFVLNITVLYFAFLRSLL